MQINQRMKARINEELDHCDLDFMVYLLWSCFRSYLISLDYKNEDLLILYTDDNGGGGHPTTKLVTLT